MAVLTELGRLIETAARANHGRSMQEAADLATRRGAPISKSMISESARHLETVTPKVIRGIAAGYDLPEEDVARAMLADLGFAIPGYNHTAESAIRRDPELSTEARAILLAGISAARRTPERERGTLNSVVSNHAQDTGRAGWGLRRTAPPGDDTRVRRDKNSG